jgi:hypothetical protein
MQLRVGPSVPRLVGAFAVACELGAVLAIWSSNLGLNTDVEPLLPWVLRLWAVGGVAALIGLVLGLTADRRGPTIPIALLAILVAVPAGVLLFLASRDG